MECEENGRTGTRKESSGYMSISGPLFKPETSRGVFFFFFWYLKLAIIMLSTEGGRRRLVDLHIKRNEKNRVSVLDNAVFGLYIC